MRHVIYQSVRYFADYSKNNVYIKTPSLRLLLRISFKASPNGMTLVKCARVEVAVSTLLIYHETPHINPPSSSVIQRLLAFFRFMQRNGHWQKTLEFQRKSAKQNDFEIRFEAIFWS